MKVFISWSKSLSKECAELLKTWINCNLQSTDPWISSQDIDKGSLWFGEISDQLKETSVGIVCLTKENKDNPWILFESGALAKGLSSNRVCTLLVDLTSADIDSPLAQFNHTSLDKAGMKSLLKTINTYTNKPLENHVFNKTFDLFWPDFEKDINNVLSKYSIMDTHKPERSSEEILAEILETTRSLDRRLRKIEGKRTRTKFPQARFTITDKEIVHSSPLRIVIYGTETLKLPDISKALSTLEEIDIKEDLSLELSDSKLMVEITTTPMTRELRDRIFTAIREIGTYTVEQVF